MLDALGPFQQAAQGGELVGEFVQLAAAAADHHAGHLAGQAQHRRVDAPGGGECRGGVEHAGTRHDGVGGGAAGRAGIAESHVGGGLLVARVDQAERSWRRARRRRTGRRSARRAGRTRCRCRGGSGCQRWLLRRSCVAWLVLALICRARWHDGTGGERPGRDPPMAALPRLRGDITGRDDRLLNRHQGTEMPPPSAAFDLEATTMRRVSWRLMPFLLLAYLHLLHRSRECRLRRRCR